MVIRVPSWNEVYEQSRVEELPWFSRKLDRDLQSALAGKEAAGKAFLCIGEGPGTQAITLSKMGFEVTATDIAPAAIQKAQARAAREKAAVNFIVDDILDSRLKKPFEMVFDRGCFHTLSPEDRQTYIKTVNRLLVPDGTLFLKCFSVKQPGSGGPYRFSPALLAEIFGKRFELESARETAFEGTLRPNPKALFAILRNLSHNR